MGWHFWCMEGRIMNSLVKGLATGFVFGFLLQRGRVLRFEKQVGAMRLQDMTILKFMLSAIVVGMVGIGVLAELEVIQLSHKPLNLGAVILGGGLFGGGGCFFFFFFFLFFFVCCCFLGGGWCVLGFFFFGGGGFGGGGGRCGGFVRGRLWGHWVRGAGMPSLPCLGCWWGRPCTRRCFR